MRADLLSFLTAVDAIHFIGEQISWDLGCTRGLRGSFVGCDRWQREGRRERERRRRRRRREQKRWHPRGLRMWAFWLWTCTFRRPALPRFACLLTWLVSGLGEVHGGFATILLFGFCVLCVFFFFNFKPPICNPKLDHIFIQLGPTPPTSPSLPNLHAYTCMKLLLVGNQCDNT